jgi:N-acetylmuramoyl-L-alanine amidase
MAEVDRLKRRLLAELVQENVDLIQGRRRPRLAGPRRDWRRAAAAAAGALALAALGLVGGARLVPAAPARPAALRQARLAIRRPTLPATSSNTALDARLPVPGPIDPAAFPLAVRRIVLDSGHGGEDVGTHTRSGVTEKSLTLDIAWRLRQLLSRDFDVLMTREDDRAVALEDRAALANRAGADLFVSIHLNWIANPRERGVETYYLGATDDPVLTELAAAENRGSRYSLADMRKILDRLYTDVRQDSSRRLAGAIQTALFHSLAQVNPALDDRGVKAAPFLVLVSTEMPAVLAEVSCLSNDDDVRLLSQDAYRQSIAEALARGIRSYAGEVARSGVSVSRKES